MLRVFVTTIVGSRQSNLELFLASQRRDRIRRFDPHQVAVVLRLRGWLLLVTGKQQRP